LHYELCSKQDLINELVELRKLTAEQQKQIEALRDSEEKYRTLFNSLDDGFCIIEVIFDETEQATDWRCLEVNERLMAHTGISDAKGKLISEMLPGIEKTWLDFFGGVVKSGVPGRLEDKVQGLGRWYDISACKIGEGESNQAAVLFRNITVRKKAEIAISESEQVYRNLLKKSKDGFILAELIYDKKGQPADFRVLHANEAAGKIVGVSPSHIGGKTARDIYLELDDGLKDMVSTGQPHYLEYYEKRSRQWYETLIFPYIMNTVGVVFRNITEKKRAEEKLHESEERFRMIFNASPISAAIVDLESGTILDVNDTSLRVMGYERWELVGKNSLALDERPENQARRKMILEALKTGENGVITEGTTITKNGKKIDGLITTQRIDMYGRPCALLQAIDISDRKRAEEEFRKLEERFTKVFEYSPAMIVIVRMSDNKILEANKRFLEVMGFTREEAMGSSVTDLGVWEEINEPIDNLISDLMSNGELPVREYLMRTKAGRMIVVQHSATLIQFGEDLCRVAMMQDVTREKQWKVKQARTQARFKTFFNSCPTAMIVFYYENKQIIDVNPAGEKLFRCNKQEVLGKTWEESGVYHRSVPEWQAMSINLYKEGNARQEVDILLADGSQIRVITSVTRLPGKPEQALASIVDVTELRSMEAEIARLDRLHLVGEMAASISHEIRNPMTSVRGFLQMLESKPEYREDVAYFDLMIEELDRANSIISEYLSMAKNKMINLQPQSLDGIVSAMLPMLRSDANLREIDIRLELNNPRDVMADKHEIRQLIINIAHNGLEAMNQSGTLTIGTFQEESKAVLYIRDEGPGMTDDILASMGRPFFTTKEKGTGLGLPVCYSIIERHQGRIDVTTDQTGTTFYIRLPLIIS